jgi:hypothetical protein
MSIENPNNADSGDEDDYMNMVFDDPNSTKHESSLQRRARQRKEGEQRGINKTKQEIEEENRKEREAALSKQLASSSKGFKMLSKLGYKAGSALGKQGANYGGGLLEPIRVELKEDRGGIGVETEKKRKAKEVLDSVAKRAKESELDYRDRMAEERAEKKREGQIIGAQKIAEKMDTEKDEEEGKPARPLNKVNVLWRDLARQRVFKENEARARKELFSRGEEKLPGIADDSDEDDDDKLAMGKLKDDGLLLEAEVEEEDEEVEGYNALPSTEKLEKLVMYLRETYHYCFWCKYEYEDDKMDGCPGLTEEDHE